MTSQQLALISVLAGAALGLCSGLVLSSLRQRQEVALCLLEHYLAVRKDIVDSISYLTDIETTRLLDPNEKQKHRETVAKLFYRHYDFLPTPVLDALVLLSVALANSAGGLFKVENRAILPLSAKETPAFIERCSLYRNASLLACLTLKSSDQTSRANQAIKLHARHVLYTLNQYMTEKELRAIGIRFRKVSGKTYNPVGPADG